MAEPMRVGPGFAPVAGEGSHILILGSFPSPKSRETGFYYGHPRNRFWPLMARLTGQKTPETLPEKRALILENGFALWDVIESCTIEGASDASITGVTPNRVAELCREFPIRAVFCNGDTACRLYRKYLQPVTGIPAEKLPSTSPANAAWSLERLTEAWEKNLAEARNV